MRPNSMYVQNKRNSQQRLLLDKGAIFNGILVAITMCISPQFAISQLPASQAWLIEISASEDGTNWTPDEILYLSSFNTDGYNNQPFFIDERTLLLSTGKDTTTDLMGLRLHTEEVYKITRTKESEFSPGLTPDGKSISFVRLEKDGTQRVWNLPRDRSTYGSPVTPLQMRVGYYSWLDNDKIALYLLREDHHELVIWNRKTGKEVPLTSNPGRALETDSDGRLFYVVKSRSETRHIYIYDPQTEKSERLVRMIPGGSVDFCIGPEGVLFTVSDGMIMTYKPGEDAYWKPQFALNIPGAEKFTRIASDKQNRICIISKP